MERRKAKQIKIGNLSIGGNEPIAVQSMLNRRSDDIEGSVAQARQLEQAGCEYSKGSVRIPYGEDLPLSLIAEIAAWCRETDHHA